MDHRAAALAALWVLAGCTASAGAQERRAGYDEMTVSCESREGRRTSCPAKLEGYRFSDLRQQSEAPCEAGRSWGYTPLGVWVAEGCRAEFYFTRDGQGATGERRNRYDNTARAPARDYEPSSRAALLDDERIVTCESEDGRREECPADLRGMRFADLRQLSRASCEIGRNFGYDDRGVWVEDGCRGEFLFRPSGGSADYGRSSERDRESRAYEEERIDSRGALVSCESVDEGYSHCEAPGIVSARVSNQLSRSECIQGTSWGIDPRGIWVDRGCRAEFEVFTRLSDSPTRPSRW